MGGEGQRLSGSTRIPVAEMARASLDKIFPHLSPEQVAAIREGRPVPPSPDWRPPGIPAPIEHLLAFGRGRPSGLPLVSAILVFGDQGRAERRVTLARRAVNQFVRQVYPNKQLVVANATDQAVTNRPHPAVKEIQVKPGPLGSLRNQALSAADGDWVMPFWDDDDVYDPFLVDYLMRQAAPGHAVAANTQARVHIYKMTAYLHYEEGGIANTMIVPRSDAVFSEEWQWGEDETFWKLFWQHKAVIADTRAYPLNLLKVCAYHRYNASPEVMFMVNHAAPEHAGRLYLSEEERDRLGYLLAPFGVGISRKEAEEQTVQAD
jgi:hypothetical protein